MMEADVPKAFLRQRQWQLVAHPHQVCSGGAAET